MDNIKQTPTVNLVHILCEATDQNIINIIAYELACRIYVPDNNQGVTFEQLLNDFGYKTKKEDIKQLKRK
jgi:hypothetical protein